MKQQIINKLMPRNIANICIAVRHCGGTESRRTTPDLARRRRRGEGNVRIGMIGSRRTINVFGEGSRPATSQRRPIATAHPTRVVAERTCWRYIAQSHAVCRVRLASGNRSSQHEQARNIMKLKYGLREIIVNIQYKLYTIIIQKADTSQLTTCNIVISAKAIITYN